MKEGNNILRKHKRQSLANEALCTVSKLPKNVDKDVYDRQRSVTNFLKVSISDSFPIFKITYEIQSSKACLEPCQTFMTHLIYENN